VEAGAEAGAEGPADPGASAAPREAGGDV
jgi:hypothetical protein